MEFFPAVAMSTTVWLHHLNFNEMPGEKKGLVWFYGISTILGWRIVEFIPFPVVLALCEIQTALSRIRTKVALSISFHTIASIWHLKKWMINLVSFLL